MTRVIQMYANCMTRVIQKNSEKHSFFGVFAVRQILANQQIRPLIYNKSNGTTEKKRGTIEKNSSIVSYKFFYNTLYPFFLVILEVIF